MKGESGRQEEVSHRAERSNRGDGASRVYCTVCTVDCVCTV